MHRDRFVGLILALILISGTIFTLPHGASAAQVSGTNALTGLVLEAGQASVLHYHQVSSGRLQWTIQLAHVPQGSETLEYSIHQQPSNGGQAVQLYSGAMTALVMSGSLDNVPAGELYITLRNTATQDDAGTHGSLEFTTSFGPLLSPDDNRPPMLQITSPLPGNDLWGDATELLMTVLAEPFFPVFFQQNNAAVPAGADGTAESLVTLPAGLQHELQALSVGPTGHLTTSRLKISRHLLSEPPLVEGAYSLRPTVKVRVPDISLIDLQLSTLTLNGTAFMLRVDDDVLYTAPSEDLPLGMAQARLQLIGRADKFAGKQPLLENYSWELQLGGSRTVQLWPDKYSATINGEAYTLDAAPFIDRTSASTMVPFRFIAEAMGADVSWLEQSRQVTFQLAGTSIVLTLDSSVAKVNGEDIPMLLAPRLESGRTMVPLRFVSEQLGASVNWEDSTNTITIGIGD